MSLPRLFRRRARAFSLLEASVSVVILSVLIAASLEVAGLSARAGALAARRAQASLLAHALHAEIRGKAYADPGVAPLFGTEADEDPTDRADFDDADDYHGYTETVVTGSDGLAVPGLGAWKRSVNVVWVQPGDPGLASLTETGAKRVRVSVFYNGTRVLRSFAIVTSERSP